MRLATDASQSAAQGLHSLFYRGTSVIRRQDETSIDATTMSLVPSSFVLSCLKSVSLQ